MYKNIYNIIRNLFIIVLTFPYYLCNLDMLLKYNEYNSTNDTDKSSLQYK